MAEYIYEITKDSDGVECYVKRGEIVRCKDCKYGIDWDGRLGCEWHGFYQTEPNWFCADGERREDG